MVNGSAILGYAGDVFSSISLFGYGSSILWVIWSFAISWFASDEAKDKIMGTIILLTTGGILFYSQVSEKIIILIVLVLTIIMGVLKVLREK